jgi:hypothetical protein
MNGARPERPSRWRINTRRNEANPAGLACVLRFPSPLRRRYASGPAFGLLAAMPIEAARRCRHSTERRSYSGFSFPYR